MHAATIYPHCKMYQTLVPFGSGEITRRQGSVGRGVTGPSDFRDSFGDSFVVFIFYVY